MSSLTECAVCIEEIKETAPCTHCKYVACVPCVKRIPPPQCARLAVHVVSR
jgi:hypothetical protein